MKLSSPLAPRRTARGHEKPESGFMYLEVLAAICLLSFVLLASVPLFVMAQRQSASAGDMTVAMSIAQGKADDLKSADYATLASGTGRARVGSMWYSTTWTVQADTPFAGLKTVVVTVHADRATPYGGVHDAVLRFARVR